MELVARPAFHVHNQHDSHQPDQSNLFVGGVWMERLTDDSPPFLLFVAGSCEVSLRGQVELLEAHGVNVRRLNVSGQPFHHRHRGRGLACSTRLGLKFADRFELARLGETSLVLLRKTKLIILLEVVFITRP